MILKEDYSKQQTLTWQGSIVTLNAFRFQRELCFGLQEMRSLPM